MEEASQGRLEAGYEEPVQVEVERAEEVESIQREEILQLVADRRRRQRMTVRGAPVKTIWVKDALDGHTVALTCNSQKVKMSSGMQFTGHSWEYNICSSVAFAEH